MHLATPRLVQSPPSLPFAGTSSLRGLRDANVPCALLFGCGWNDASLPALPLETLIRRPQTHIAMAVDESRACGQSPLVPAQAGIQFLRRVTGSPFLRE